MEFATFSQEIEKKLHLMGIELTENQEKQFYSYMKQLVEWNEKINLTAIIKPQDIILKHFVDSITILKEIRVGDKVLDIGTGAGFPGIPLKIMKQDMEVTLVDSLNKRVLFLNEMIKELGLTKINAIHARAEELAKNKEHRQKYDIVTSRAVASLNVLLEYMLPFVKVGGLCLCMKGPDVEQEIIDSKKALSVLGGELIKKEELLLPESDIKRTLIFLRKVKDTPKQFPRKAGKPSKEPLD